MRRPRGEARQHCSLLLEVLPFFSMNGAHFSARCLSREDRLHRAGGLAGLAVDALVGMDVVLILALVDAVDGAYSTQDLSFLDGMIWTSTGRVRIGRGPDRVRKIDSVATDSGRTQPTRVSHGEWSGAIQPDRICGYVPQKYSLFPDKTVLDNVTFGLDVGRFGAASWLIPHVA